MQGNITFEPPLWGTPPDRAPFRRGILGRLRRALRRERPTHTLHFSVEGRTHGHDHDHDHGHEHDHDHGHEHDHDHGHEHDHDHGHEHDHDHGHEHDHEHGHDHDHEGHVSTATREAHDHDHDHDHGHDDGHEHGHGHDHDHDHSHDYRDLSRQRLTFSLFLILTYMVAEIVGGIISGSLALIADALHMLTDGAAIALALFAIWLAGKPATVERTFGYQRAEVLAALTNALTLWLIAAWVFFEAYHRFAVETPDIEGGLVLIVGGIGLLINIVVAYLLHASAEHSLNAEGAFQHVMADLIGSVGVIIAAIFIMTLGWDIADPIIGVFIGVLIIYSSRGLMGKVMHVLLEGTPRHIDPYQLCSELEEVEGVTVIHDVHVTTVTSGYDQLSAHILADPNYDGDYDEMLRKLRRIASEEFGINHITIQLETSVQGCTEDHHVDHLAARARHKKD